MDHIYLHEENAGRIQFIPCALTSRSRAYQNRTLWEIDQIRVDERRGNALARPDQLGARINLTDAIQNIVGEAETMRPEVDTSNRQRVSGIRGNRREERRDNQNREAFRFTALPPPDGGTVVPFTPNPPAEEQDYALPSIVDILKRFDTDGSGDDER